MGRRAANSTIGQGTPASEPGDDDNARKSKDRKKTNITIALDDYIFKEMRKEAEDSRQSLNALVSDVLRKHINFYRTAELTGVVIVPPNVFQFFINETDEKQLVKEMTKAGTDLVPSFFAQKGSLSHLKIL
jgi:hypothetical protein